jgi:hypothetical protein
VFGLERTVTKRSGKYSAPKTTAAVLTGSTVYRYRQCLKKSEEKGGLTVNLQLQPGEIAIIVWDSRAPLKSDESVDPPRTMLWDGDFLRPNGRCVLNISTVFSIRVAVTVKTDDVPKNSNQPIPVLNSSRLPASLAADRTVLGTGYKPWAVQLGNGDVLVVSFAGGDLQNPQTHKKVKFEYAMFWRSRDGGRSWNTQPRPDLPGREFSASVLSDGTLLLPNVLPKNYLNSRNTSDMNHVTSSRLFRSTDHGHSFTLLPSFDACKGTPHGKGAPCPQQTGTDWTAVELPPAAAIASPGSVRLAIGVCSSAESKLGKPGSPPSTVSLLHSTDSGQTFGKKQSVDTSLCLTTTASLIKVLRSDSAQGGGCTQSAQTQALENTQSPTTAMMGCSCGAATMKG